MKKISVVIPVYNEEGTISELYRRLKSALDKDLSFLEYEVIFVDDGSTDGTFSLLEELHYKDSAVKIVQFSRNFGHHIAVSAGIDYAMGDFVLMMDGDLQDQPEEIIKLYTKLQEGYDVVYGERRNKKFSLFKRFCSWSFIFVIQKLVDKKIIINSHVFRLMTKQVADEVRKLHEISRYVIGLIGWVGFKHTSVSVEHGVRFSGETKYSFRQLVRLAFDAIFSFSDYPLRLITQFGFCLVIVGFILAFVTIFEKIVYGISPIGWASIFTSLFIIGGVQIFILGILGNYLGRIYMETKRRPLYVIRKFVRDEKLREVKHETAILHR